ncbi:hypothetical protein [Marinobacter fonticola]|uniref:hypothetical protein n=1 Tax=Marinobacter fonticola TaxID=2603215 RepID=UPI0011E71886|nr:hypothetical protein [Marinobacter fonticola]
MSLAADLSLAAHVPSEDDRFGYHFFAKAYGRPERHTSFVPMTYGDALTRVEELRESGYVGVELYLLTDI